MERVRHILLATDGSQGALGAAALAGLLARNCDSKVTIVTVHSEAALVLPGITDAALPGSVPYTPFPEKEAKKHIESVASEKTLPEAEQALGSVPGGVDSVQLWGHAAEQICDYAAANSVDMIVVGGRGHGAFKRLLLGSVSSQVTAHAGCAVVVAR